MNENTPVVVTVKQSFTASAEQVFDAWLDPSLISRWMFGPALRDEQVQRIDVDPHVGHKFSFVVLRQGKEIDHLGEYLLIERPHRLDFTWGVRENLPHTSKVSVQIQPLVSGCELTLSHELHPDWKDFAVRVGEGWTKMLGVLHSLLG